MQEALDRVSNAKTELIRLFDHVAREQGVMAELDTLRRWSWRSADLGQRIQLMNRVVYDFTDQLPADSYSPSDRDKVREALLEHWQQWNSQVEAKIKAIKNKERG